MIDRTPMVRANSIRQKGQSHKGSFLIVEGSDDRQFFKLFVDPNLCSIQVVKGKQNVIDVLAILEEAGFSRVVGIADADFDHIEGIQTSSRNLIILETVDLEALLIQSAALDRVLSVLGSTSKITKFGKKVRVVLVEAAVWIGCLRLHSRRNELDLKFKGLKYARCISRESLEINIEALVQEVKNNTSRHDLDSQGIVAELQSIFQTLDDYWLISFGKDMVEILSIGLRKALSTKDAKEVEPNSVKKKLWLAFHRVDLDKSRLGRDLREWEARNSGYYVLSHE